MMMNELIYTNLRDYLTTREWVLVSSKDRYDLFSPPESLGFERSFNLFVPNNIDKKDFEANYLKLIETLSSIYKEDIDDNASIIIEDKQVMQFHVDVDHGNKDEGRPSVPFFDEFLTRIKELLQNNATFSITKKPHFYDQIEESERYLNLCKFMKNIGGSLTTKIQVPKSADIKEETVFEEPIKGENINNELINVISFVNTEIINGRAGGYDEEYLKANRALISVNVIDKVHDLYRDIKYNNIDITLLGTGLPKRTVATELTPRKNNNLKVFTKTVKEKINEITSEDIWGKVISLTSKDILGDQNTITVLGSVRNISADITVKLPPNEYQRAIKAHGRNMGVFINGVLEKEKTRYRLTKLNQFKVIGLPEETPATELPLGI
jgi:hypothetical protein